MYGDDRDLEDKLPDLVEALAKRYAKCVAECLIKATVEKDNNDCVDQCAKKVLHL